jgi:hypothetical protein
LRDCILLSDRVNAPLARVHGTTSVNSREVRFVVRKHDDSRISFLSGISVTGHSFTSILLFVDIINNVLQRATRFLVRPSAISSSIVVTAPY